MPRILYGVSPIGLGHATRSGVVAKRLAASGAEVRLFSGGKAADYLSSLTPKVADIVSEPRLTVEGGEMRGVVLWYLSSWLANRRTVPRTKALAEDFRPDVVVCDEEFSGMMVAEGLKVPRVLVADELELGFARTWAAAKLEERIQRWYSGLQASVDLLLIPGSGTDSGNKRYVGPIVRAPTLDRESSLAKYGVPPTRRVILLSLSGSGLGAHLVPPAIECLRMKALADACLVVAGNRGRKLSMDKVYDVGVVDDNQNLVAAADIVISTAGKSTIDEAAAAGTPIVAIPIRHHAEQERNGAELGFAPEDASRIPEIVSAKIGRREAPRRFVGAENASRLILSLARR